MAQMGPVAEISEPPVPSDVFDRFPGRWVAVRQGEAVADAPSLEELEANGRVNESDTCFRVPEEGAKFF
jgi:hypothetical protein